MHGLPNNFETINAVADVIREEDNLKAIRKGERSSTVNGIVNGVVLIQQDEVDDVYIPIQLTKDYEYPSDHIIPGKESPNAMIIKNTEGQVFVVVNEIFMKWNNPAAPVWKQSISEAILHHEIGHYRAGHLADVPVLRLDRIDQDKLEKANDVFPILAEALINGAVYSTELEADIQAMRSIDDPMKIIALRSYLATTSDTLGIRMENSNRVDRLIQTLEQDEWERNHILDLSTVDYYFSTDTSEETEDIS